MRSAPVSDVPSTCGNPLVVRLPGPTPLIAAAAAAAAAAATEVAALPWRGVPLCSLAGTPAPLRALAPCGVDNLQATAAGSAPGGGGGCGGAAAACAAVGSGEELRCERLLPMLAAACSRVACSAEDRSCCCCCCFSACRGGVHAGADESSDRRWADAGCVRRGDAPARAPPPMSPPLPPAQSGCSAVMHCKSRLNCG
eukprot:344303-Chlamydomonas_euryale.AAC.2